MTGWTLVSTQLHCRLLSRTYAFGLRTRSSLLLFNKSRTPIVFSSRMRNQLSAIYLFDRESLRNLLQALAQTLCLQSAG